MKNPDSEAWFINSFYNISEESSRDLETGINKIIPNQVIKLTSQVNWATSTWEYNIECEIANISIWK